MVTRDWSLPAHQRRAQLLKPDIVEMGSKPFGLPTHEGARANPKIHKVRERDRVLSELPYWISDAKWAKLGEMTVDENGQKRTGYLAKVVYLWERPAPHVNVDIIYGLFTADLETGRPNVVNYIGGLQFEIVPEATKKGWTLLPPVARVVHASLGEKWRGKGLGKFMYKGALNDLLEVEGVSCVKSDYTRSIDAERVWASICRTAPGQVYTVPSKLGARGHIFETRGPTPIRRRPVKVREHRRRR